MEEIKRNFDNVPVMWKPNENSGTQIKKLMKSIEKKYKTKFNDYWDFHEWSVDNIAEFWAELWDFFGIIYSKKYQQLIDINVHMAHNPRWFVGAELNFAENLLKYRDDEIALILSGEERETAARITYAQLYEAVRLYAAAFRKCGLKKGDVVVCYMSNRVEPVLAMLAAVSIGAIWTGALPLLGSQAVLNRFSQVNPKFLLTIDRFVYNQEEIQMLEKVKYIVDGLPTLEKVIIVPSKEESKTININKIKNSCFIEKFLLEGKEKDGSVPPLTFEQVSFSYPVFINYTSGTTGLPKPLVHASGMLLTIARDFSIHCDSTREAIWLATSPVGWASWNMLATLLSVGMTVLLYDGYPFFLSPTYLWDTVEEFKISHFFLQANVLEELEKRKFLPTKNHSLLSLKTIVVGGSVVKPSSYDFVYRDLQLKCSFSSCYGLSETMGCPFIIEHTVPIHRGEIPVISLGTSLKFLNEEGKSVIGEVGELVMTMPSPGYLIGLWNDPDGSKFREKYYSKYRGKFLLGDHGLINPVTKGIIICGRSDETLKQRGCRFGSSEIYNIVDSFEEVHDSLCVSQYSKDLDERAVLFLRMMDGYSFNESLVSRIRETITKELTSRHVPDVILEIKDIPYNLNGKKMEMVVKNIINHKEYCSETIFNPECIEYYKNIPELQGF